MAKKKETGFTIHDPILEPFYIKKDTEGGGFVIMEKVETSKTGYDRNVAYPARFDKALKMIAELKLGRRKANTSYDTLKEYIEEWKKIQEEISEAVKEI